MREIIIIWLGRGFDGAGYWVLDTGYWVLGTGYWVLGTDIRCGKWEVEELTICIQCGMWVKSMDGTV